MRDIHLLVDYRGAFYSSAHESDASMNVALLVDCFQAAGYRAIVKEYPDIDFRQDNYEGQLVLYQSSDDRFLFYQSYLEDLLLGLELQGAILLPRFHLFRAHHNKLFQEVLKDLMPQSALKTISAQMFGTYEDYAARLDGLPEKVVLKPAEGATGSGVQLLASRGDKIKHGKQASRSFHLIDAIKNWVKIRMRKGYVPRSNHRRKFVVQSLVEGLEGDYKVLVYGRKYYVLQRLNREGDFRASGSGRISHPANPPDGLLDFVEMFHGALDSPILSVDVGITPDGTCHLIEFQCLHFGTTTLLKSPYYFTRDASEWSRVDEKSILEQELVNSVALFIDEHGL